MLPFTREQFVAVFAAYNEAIWPAQALAYLLGLGMLLLLLRPSPGGDRLIGAGLVAMWAWTGIAYHGLHFSAINRAALFFGAVFVLQAVLLFHAGVVRGRLRFGVSGGASPWLGGAMVLYAAVLYPLLGLWTGHRPAELPMFGITPCPVTIVTFGLLLLTTARVPRLLLVIPFLWSLVGGSAAFLLDVPQDWLLLFSGIALVPIVLRDHSPRPAATGA